jgi:DNA-binding transcriptional MerR regulator
LREVLVLADYEQLLTIRQASKLTGLTAHTLRYYERIALLTPVGRASNGHRRYGKQDVERITFINYLRLTGMPLELQKEHTALLSRAMRASRGASRSSEPTATRRARRRPGRRQGRTARPGASSAKASPAGRR